MKKEIKELYVSPEVETVELKVEQGFATSDPQEWGAGNDNWF